MEEPRASPSHADSEHYKEMAQKLRELARQFRFPGARQELLKLALRYERSSTHEAHRPSPTRNAISTTPGRGNTAAQGRTSGAR
jgi:hypothetical protein